MPRRARFIFANRHVVGIGLLPEDRQVVAVAAVGGDELVSLNEHASGTAGRVEHSAVVRLKHLDEQVHDLARRVELAGLLALVGGELA